VKHFRNLLKDSLNIVLHAIYKYFRTLANFVVLRVVDFIASQSRSELGAIYERFQRKIDGRLDRQQAWRECVDVLTENLPFAIGEAFIKNHFKIETKAAFGEMYRNIKDEFATTITEAAWIDENTRDKLLNKLQSLVPLIAYPDKGFDEQAIKDFYEDIKIDKSQYLRTLFQLRIIAADDKFQQTYMSSSTNESDLWRRYLAPTSIAAQYSASDNTISKDRTMHKLS
jgi:predicted metalloendopeptidase